MPPLQAADHANVFLYHRFGDIRYPSTSVDTGVFAAHLEHLHAGGYHVVTLGTLVKHLRSGTPLPEKTVALTVDDVYRSFIDEALPLLQRYGYPATLFISSASVGGRDFLNWAEIAALAAAGFEVGSHSAHHDYLLDRLPGEEAGAWRLRVLNDLEQAQRAFEEHLGRRPKLFAYPYGEYDPALAGLVREAGFVAAFGQQSGVVASGEDVFTLPRFPMAGRYAGISQFREKLSMRPLPVKVVSPRTTRLDTIENPPKLRVRIDFDAVEMASLRCYVNGRPECVLEEEALETGLIEVGAAQPLTGRRNKYTLTAHDGSGRIWYWFSQLWVSPRGQHSAE